MTNILATICFALCLNVFCSFVMLAKFQNDDESLEGPWNLCYTLLVGIFFGLPILMILLCSLLFNLFEHK